jgi:hypothetical protein
MTQETEKEDPRQIPPKKFAEDRPAVGQRVDETGTGGLRDDEDDARGAFDDVGHDSGGASSGSSVGGASRGSGDKGGSRES